MKFFSVKTCDQLILYQSVTSSAAPWFEWQKMLGKNTLNILSCSTCCRNNALQSLFDAILQVHSEFESTYEIRGIFITTSHQFFTDGKIDYWLFLL